MLAGMMLALLALTSPAVAQSRNETLIVVVESGPNSMDIHGVGANRPSYQASWNLYDRLMTFGLKTLPDGTRSYDYSVLKPELAESWQIAADGTSVTFKLRKDARFHDGTPVTARDVKWSFDPPVTPADSRRFRLRPYSRKPNSSWPSRSPSGSFLRKTSYDADIAVAVPVVNRMPRSTRPRPTVGDDGSRATSGQRRLRLSRGSRAPKTVSCATTLVRPLPRSEGHLREGLGRNRRALLGRRRDHLLRLAAQGLLETPRPASSRWSPIRWRTPTPTWG